MLCTVNVSKRPAQTLPIPLKRDNVHGRLELENEELQHPIEQLLQNDNQEKESPSDEEILEEIRKLKNGITPEGQQLQTRICHLIKLIWTQNKIPEDWYTGIITPIHKKGDKKKSSK
ncbi:hypothetical protein QE152_g35074 [Popillia japonica]|uniref:Uncharacterized protein n=1 Tax=Popillia japonica TaxID=7064 RepID=A0AAW1IS52_POPJA